MSATATQTPMIRSMPDYRGRRLIGFAIVLGVWAGGVVLAGGLVLGTLLSGVLATVAVSVYAVLLRSGDWARRLGARPWRQWEEVLDLAVVRLPGVMRRSLSGELIAANRVEVIVDSRTLLAISGSIGIARAEAELTERWLFAIRTRRAKPAAAGPLRVALHADANLARGQFVVVPVYLAMAVTADANAVTLKGAPPTRPYTHEESTVVAVQAFPLRLAFAARTVRVQKQATPLLAGRSSACDIRIIAGPGEQVDQVSRRHAEFWVDAATGSWFVQDRSTNGLRLNDARVAEPAALSDGDVLAFGANSKAPRCVIAIAPQQ